MRENNESGQEKSKGSGKKERKRERKEVRKERRGSLGKEEWKRGNARVHNKPMTMTMT